MNLLARKITSLIKARDIFERFRTDMVDDRDRAGAIQAFEFCCELAWKTLKHCLAIRGQETGSPRDTIRKAAAEGLIDDPSRWFDYLEKRNLAAHTYESATMDRILIVFDSFSRDIGRLIDQLLQETNGN